MALPRKIKVNNVQVADPHLAFYLTGEDGDFPMQNPAVKVSAELKDNNGTLIYSGTGCATGSASQINFTDLPLTLVNPSSQLTLNYTLVIRFPDNSTTACNDATWTVYEGILEGNTGVVNNPNPT